jgi:hypothetical protein
MAAKMAARQGCAKFLAVSGMLSSASSSIELFRVKVTSSCLKRKASLATCLKTPPPPSFLLLPLQGEMQDAVQKLSIPCIRFIQPSLIVGKRTHARLDEDCMFACFKWINPCLEPCLGKPLFNPAEDVALALLFTAMTDDPSTAVKMYHSGHIKQRARECIQNFDI